MPELPEVEVICRGIAPHVIGQKLHFFRHSGKALRHPIPVRELVALRDHTITAVSRRAKYILLTLASGKVVVFHLGMTGNLGIFPTDSPRRKHDHLEWDLGNNSCLRYHDPRRFGSVAVLPNLSDEAAAQIFKNCGPEPLTEAFSGKVLSVQATGKAVPVKAFIMESRNVVGVGNIYASESLFSAGIHPARAAGTLSPAEWERLATSIQETLTNAITCGGSTISDFRNADQQSGYFQMHFNVYGKQGKPCPACNRPLEKVTIRGRSSFFCPDCQK